MIRDIHLSFDLRFSTAQEQADSEEVLLRLLGINALLDLMELRRDSSIKPLYESGIVYTPPDQADGRPPLTRSTLSKLLRLLREDVGADPETALMVVRMLKGIEIFLGLQALYKRGMGDCNELVPIRIAELWRGGIIASPYLTKQIKPRGNGISYHAIILHGDGSSEDPSLILGMGGPERADERAEEIRKNAERREGYMAAAQHLIHEGASPIELSRQIDSMGLVPSDGVFRSPYGKVA